MSSKVTIASIIKKSDAPKKQKKEIQQMWDAKEWYTIRAILGNQWANWYVLIGARERGKTFTVQDHVLNQYFNPKSKGYKKPFYWLRLNDVAVRNMLMNNFAKGFEPLLVRKYHLEDMKVKGDTVFIKGHPLCYIQSLSTAYNSKGSAIFDQEDKRNINIIIDEVALEKGQKKTFDVVYNLKMQVENIVRSRRAGVRIFMMLNNTEECPEIVAMFGYIPLDFGVYKLKRKHCVMDYIANNKAYEGRRKKALANEIDNGTGNFTNKVRRDLMLIYKGRLNKPTSIIKFSKDPMDWFTLWDNNVIKMYCNENASVIAMRRYIDEVFNPEQRDSVIAINDVRGYKFRDVLTQSLFYKELEIIKK